VPHQTQPCAYAFNFRIEHLFFVFFKRKHFLNINKVWIEQTGLPWNAVALGHTEGGAVTGVQ
jgi:hypothetical protein